MARHYNPWQERFEAVCKEIDKKSEAYRADHPAAKGIPLFWFRELCALKKVIGTENAYKHMIEVHQASLDSLKAELIDDEISREEQLDVYSEIAKHRSFIELLTTHTSNINHTEDLRVRRLISVITYRFSPLFTLKDVAFIEALVNSIAFPDNFTSYNNYLESYFNYAYEEFQKDPHPIPGAFKARLFMQPINNCGKEED